MWDKRLVLGLIENWKIPYVEQLELWKQSGFDGFFLVWNKDLDMTNICNKADELGLFFQSLHAPWNKAADMWHDDDKKGSEAILELKECVDVCAAHHIPLLVVHAFIGFDEHNPTEIGLERFGNVVDYAHLSGVKIAFENTEGEEYLETLMNHFKENDTVGFCWDTGHEMCYNHSKDMMSLYGDRLLGTHLNDNLGIRDFSGTITWLDDLHLLPFDGIADWDGIADRLAKHGYDGDLTFELNTASKPNRHENDCYANMSPEIYMAEVYKRACRVAALLKWKHNKA